jgi:membrane-associated protein
MRTMFDWVSQLYTDDGLSQLLRSGGLILILGIIFAETGLLVGFFLPGDSLLVTAGVLCALDPTNPDSAPIFSFWTLTPLACLAAIVGDAVNFWLGKFTGDRIWEKPDGRFFKRKYLVEAHEFYERHGGLALAAARFIPIARTFVPFVAGMSRMPYPRFALWNVVGAILWVFAMTALGHWCGQRQVFRENLHYLILAIIAISFIPVIIGMIKRMLKAPAVDEPH